MEAKLDMVLEQVGRDKNIDKAVLISALEQAILTAAKKSFGLHREMEAQYNEDSGAVDLFLIVNVVMTYGKEWSKNTARVAEYRLQYPWATKNLLDPAVPGSPPCEGEVVARYWQSIWQTSQTIAHSRK